MLKFFLVKQKHKRLTIILVKLGKSHYQSPNSALGAQFRLGSFV